MKLTAIGGLSIGFYGVATLDYVPEVEKLHRVCLAKPEVYQLSLAAEILRDVVYVWWVAIVFPGGTRLDYEIAPTFSAAIKGLAVAQIELNDFPSSLLQDDAVNSLTVKLAADRVILQDLVGAILAQPQRHTWELGASATEIVSVIRVIADCALEAIERRQPLAKFWGMALFESGYLTLRADRLGQQESARVVKALFTSWRRLLAGFEDTQHAYGWQHSMFGLLGYGFGIYKERSSPTMRDELDRSVRALVAVPSRGEGGASWADEERVRYVQLAGAWSAWVGLDGAATGCAELAASMPAPTWEAGLFEGRYGRFGYPTIMHADFFLPNLPTCGSTSRREIGPPLHRFKSR